MSESIYSRTVTNAAAQVVEESSMAKPDSTLIADRLRGLQAAYDEQRAEINSLRAEVERTDFKDHVVKMQEMAVELGTLRTEVERLRRVEYAAMAVVTSRDEADDYMHKAVVSRHCLADLAAALSAKPATVKEGA